MWNQWQILFSWAPESLRMVTAAMKLKDACSLEKSYDKPRQHVQKQRHHFADKCSYSQSYGFSCSHIRMWELKHKKGWALKNWCFWTVVLEKTSESSLRSKEIKPVNPKGNQHWIFLERTDAEAPILWQRVYLMYTPIPDAKSQLIGKDSDAAKDWGQEDKQVTEDETVGWHHQLDGHRFGWTPGVGDGQGGLVCCKESQRVGQVQRVIKRVRHDWVTELNLGDLWWILPF